MSCVTTPPDDRRVSLTAIGFVCRETVVFAPPATVVAQGRRPANKASERLERHAFVETNVVADAVMLVWIPAVAALFACLKARRAAAVSLVGAWLFLPLATYDIPLLPDYSKVTATNTALLVGLMMFAPSKLSRLRFRWIDWPVCGLCISPLFASLSNGLGAYDGVSGSAGAFIMWGMPWIVGRAVFGDARGLHELAKAMLAGAVVYVPLCLFEVRMSPQLHTWVYGWHQHSFAQSIRMGGWRPTVFMDHGLMVATWMATGTLIAMWFVHTRAARSVVGLPIRTATATLFATTILCKSMGAVVLLAGGLALLFLRSRFLFMLSLLLPPLYVAARGSGAWDGSHLVIAASRLSQDRADSLNFRLYHETMLAEKARQRMWFGWGGWGRQRIQDEEGNDVSVTDGAWIIFFGSYGVLGVTALFAMMLLPIGAICCRYNVSEIFSEPFAGVVSLCAVAVLHAADCLPNSMLNPVFTVAMGGLASIGTSAAISFAGESRVHTVSVPLVERGMWPPRRVSGQV